MLLVQDFVSGDITEYIFGLIIEFCEMKDVNFKKVVEKFDRLNKKTKSKAINTQRSIANRKKDTGKRAVIEVNPYV
jgi:GTP-binding protein EngB required for normal cell division